MDWLSRRKPFALACKAAFPPMYEEVAAKAESELQLFVDDNYRTTSTRLVANKSRIYVPYRFHFNDGVGKHLSDFSPGAHCLLTRAADGYLRQDAAKVVLGLNEEWAIPFVVLLLGEYVVEIADDIHGALNHLDRSAYEDFVLQNRDVMRSMRAKATSYWSAYHRLSYPDCRSYPALAALRQMEEWAS